MKKIVTVLLMSLLLLFCLAACNQSQISQAEYDRVVSERDALQQQLDSLLEGQNTESNTEEPLSNNETQASEQVLVEQNNIKITYMGIDNESRTKIKLRIENNSDTAITVQQRDMSINGIMIDGIFSCDVQPGKIANDSISLFSSDLEDNGITAIENIELSFHVFSEDSFDDVFDSDMITIQVQ